MMMLAHRTPCDWQAKPAGICWGSAGPGLRRVRLPATIYYWTQVVSFPPLLFLHSRTLFYRLSAGLIRADMLSVLGWTDVAVAGVCLCAFVCSFWHNSACSDEWFVLWASKWKEQATNVFKLITSSDRAIYATCIQPKHLGYCVSNTNL